MNLKKQKEKIRRYLGQSRTLRWMVLILIAAVFTIILFPNLVVTRHVYRLGEVAQRDIKAPKAFLIEDLAATLDKRREASHLELSVYDWDTTWSDRISARVIDAFHVARVALQKNKAAVLLSDGTLNVPKPLLDAIVTSPDEPMGRIRTLFESKLGIAVSGGAIIKLAQNGFSEQIADTVRHMVGLVLKKKVVPHKEILLKDNQKGIRLRTLPAGSEQVVLNLSQFSDLDQARASARAQGRALINDLDYNLQNLIVDLVQDLVHSNVTFNRSETEKRKRLAAAEVKPVLYKIKKGEMLLREGERVTATQLLKLNALEQPKKKGQTFMRMAGAAALLLILLLTLFVLFCDRHRDTAHSLNKNLIFIGMAILSAFFMVALSLSMAKVVEAAAMVNISITSVLFGIPVAASTMLVCLFLGISFALPMAIIVAMGAAMIVNIRFDLFIYFLLSSCMGAFWMQNCRERKVFILGGLKLGLFNLALVTMIDLYTSDLHGLKLFWDWGFAFFGGVTAGIITAGLVPLIEIAFGYKSDITLLELGNLEKPLLRRLMLEAPGTYHHSMVVGSMVEAAAQEIGSNPILAKVCGYYHDIGKIQKPLYFIENQSFGKNKHDKLAPSMSKRILISHIKDGVEIAQKNRMGPTIIDSIQQSHGTSLISFFFEKARKINGEGQVKEDEYRYPGPKPQTRATALVMLADVVEAASRTLENPTPARIQGLVQNLINNIFSDGQLNECELTLIDLHKIARIYTKILNGIYHHRVEYAATAAKNDGKEPDGGLGRQSPRKVYDISEKASKNSPGRLKRLGLS